MRFFKIFLLVLIILVVAGFVAVPLFVKETVAFSIPGVQKTITIEPTNVANLKTDTAEQISTLTTQASKLTDNTGKVLGSAIQADTSDTKTTSEKAVEYGKYLYCKQVVEAYETEKNE